MKLWIASYNKLIYELKINSNKWKVIDMKEVKLESFPSYLYKYKNYIAVALKENDKKEYSGIKVVNLKDNKSFEYYNHKSYTYIYMDKNYIIAASYHQGEILVINRKTNEKFFKKFDRGKIHNVGKIKKNLFYAVDIENRVVYFLKIEGSKLIENNRISIKNNRPRHLIKKRGKIYIICEDTANILCYKKEKKQYIKFQEISSVNNSKNNEAAAIKSKFNYIYTTNRGDNKVNIYKIKYNGNLKKFLCVDCGGINPRDLIIFKRNTIIVTNKDSNNLSVIKFNKKGTKIIKSFKLKKPVCIVR